MHCLKNKNKSFLYVVLTDCATVAAPLSVKSCKTWTYARHHLARRDLYRDTPVYAKWFLFLRSNPKDRLVLSSCTLYVKQGVLMTYSYLDQSNHQAIFINLCIKYQKFNKYHRSIFKDYMYLTRRPENSTMYALVAVCL